MNSLSCLKLHHYRLYYMHSWITAKCTGRDPVHAPSSIPVPALQGWHSVSPTSLYQPSGHFMQFAGHGCGIDDVVFGGVYVSSTEPDRNVHTLHLPHWVGPMFSVPDHMVCMVFLCCWIEGLCRTQIHLGNQCMGRLYQCRTMH